jgi:chromate reductase
MKVLVFAGSTRADSFNKKLARAAAQALRDAGFETTIADLSDYAMPLYDGDVETSQGLPEGARAFKQLLRTNDAVAIASPEYNGSFPAILKNTIDWISRPEEGEPHLAALRGKKAMLLSTSPGPGGGRRGLRHVRELLEMIGVSVTPAQVTIPKAGEAFGPAGELLRPDDRESLRQAAEELAGAVSGNAVAA